ncbi:MAG TPA: restriction endonuclease subunit S [Verrucomicrobiota bacterium]|nr:restriction endonuclease subunit S [Verrucomicrobiota bacterium]HNU51264.1 restriction endonuclease subunit S [Verrucomicrobiota bacterium]
MTSLPQTHSGSRLRPYPKYKDSGVEWLGRIPEHWEVKPLKRLGVVKGGNGFPDEEQGVENEELPFYKVSDMNLEGNGVVMCTHNNSVSRNTARRLGASIFLPDAIVFPKVGAALLTNKRRILSRAACIDNNTMAFTVSEGSVKFLFYRLVCIDLGRLANPGAVPSLNEKEAGEIAVGVPPAVEQHSIASFLDRETAKIDALVAKKERLIELLQEKRTALISHAVTQGLNPDAPKKDSGIPWLGRIPAHWEVKRLKFLFFNLDSRRRPLSGEERATMEKEYPYYGASGIIDRVEDYIFDEPLILVAEDGANLFSRSTPLAFPASGKYWVNNHAHILKPMDGMVDYWSQVLATVVYDPWISGSAQPKLTSENLGTIPLSVPPIRERKEILGFLDSETAKLDALTAKVRAAIERLQEYRTALISAAVTGQIDVREEAA